jgi:hypothetical protein
MKKLSLVSFILLGALMLIGTNAAADLNTGLIAHFPFDGNANDTSGNGNNGTVYGATLTTDRFGNANSVYSFDGLNDYIDYGYSPAFSPSNAITIAAWIKRNGNIGLSGSQDYIVARLDDYSTRAYYLGFWYDCLQMEVSEDGGIYNRLLNTAYPHPITDQNWHHVAGVFEEGTITLYIDGVAVYGGDIWGHANSINQNQSSLFIGFDLADGGYYFSGSIDEVRLYSRALSQSEIAQLAGLNVPPLPGPVLFEENGHYYEFVEVPDPFAPPNNSWATASAAASARTYNGLTGHLATITSQAENDFLLSLVSGSFSGFVGAWLGGKSPEGWLAGAENGQAFAYTYWNDSTVGGAEPNNGGYAYMMIGTEGYYNYSHMLPGRWIDDSNVAGQGGPDPSQDPVIGYFVEYEEASKLEITDTGPAKLWIGLKNSDDQGTQFDLRTELYLNDVLISEGQTLCITGVTRNASYAKEVSVSFGPISDGAYDSGDVLSFKVLTRIGTNPNGSKCSGPGGSHNNAVGLRFYYDSTTRASGFAAEISPDPMKDFFLHSSGASYSIDDVSPTGAVKYKDSSSINFNNGNPWKEIGTWNMTLP